MVKTGRELIEDYKSQIDLVGFLERDGFTFDRKKGMGSFITMRKEQTTLVVFKDASDQYRYFNRNDSSDKGTVVDYYAATRNLDLSKGSGDWGRLFAEMNVLIGHIPAQLAAIKPSPVVRAEQGPTPVNRYLDLRTLSDTKYLNSRGLDNATLFSFEFKDKIFNKDYKDAKSGMTYSNTAFPVENQNGFIGANVRNESYNGMFGARQDGLWLSNVDSARPPREIFLTEAPIDAISYHRMNPVNRPGERLYVASLGNYGQRQVNFVQNLIDRYSPERIVLGNDKDNVGKKFNIFLMGQLANGKSDRVDISLQKNGAEATLTFSGINVNNVDARDFANRVEEVINAGTPKELRRAEIFTFHRGEGETRMQVVMPNTIPFLRRAEQFVSQFRELPNVRVVEPTSKDFNLDLSGQIKSGIIKDSVSPSLKR